MNMTTTQNPTKTTTWTMPTGETCIWDGKTYGFALIFDASGTWMIFSAHKTEAAAIKALAAYRSRFQGHTSESGYVWGEARIIEAE